MSSRVAEKERRRVERLERHRKQVAAEQRKRRLRLVGVAVIAVAMVAAVVALAMGGGGSSKQAASGSGGAFGTHYSGLEQRRRGAGVPTMAGGDPAVHIHPVLAVYVNGRRISVPANVGIDPAALQGDMAGLHTHDASGTIHVEGVRGATLGQFFSIWGVPLTPERLGPYRARRNAKVRMWVDGKPSHVFGSLRLKDGQRIVLSYGPRGTPRRGPSARL
jgi:hypothetical protein